VASHSRRVVLVMCWGMGTPAGLPLKHDAASLTHLAQCCRSLGHVSMVSCRFIEVTRRKEWMRETQMGGLVGMRRI
jgi:hypothetical protein